MPSTPGIHDVNHQQIHDAHHKGGMTCPVIAVNAPNGTVTATEAPDVGDGLGALEADEEEAGGSRNVSPACGYSNENESSCPAGKCATFANAAALKRDAGKPDPNVVLSMGQWGNMYIVYQHSSH